MLCGLLPLLWLEEHVWCICLKLSSLFAHATVYPSPFLCNVNLTCVTLLCFNSWVARKSHVDTKQILYDLPCLTALHLCVLLHVRLCRSELRTTLWSPPWVLSCWPRCPEQWRKLRTGWKGTRRSDLTLLVTWQFGVATLDNTVLLHNFLTVYWYPSLVHSYRLFLGLC